MKVDSKLVSAGIADVERMIEEEIGDVDGIQASLLRIIVDCIAGAILTEHPRFPVGEFQIACMPMSNERMKRAILASLGEERS